MRDVLPMLTGTDAKAGLTELIQMSPEQALRELSTWAGIAEMEATGGEKAHTARYYYQAQKERFAQAAAEARRAAKAAERRANGHE